MFIGVGIAIKAGFIIISRDAQLGIEGAKTRGTNLLIYPARASINREDAPDDVDKDRAEIV